MPETPRPVRRRHVFFFSGFDPKGAAHYHRIYREQAAKQALITGEPLQVGPRTRTPGGHTQWTVRAPGAAGQEPVDTVYEYLRWDDIVRAHWPRHAWGVGWVAWRAYLASPGPMRRLWPVAPRTVMLLLYPALLWGLSGLLAATAVWAVAGLVQPLSVASAGGRWLIGGLAGAACVRAAFWLEGRLHTSWLLRIFGFARAWATGRVPGLQARLDEAAARVAHQLTDPTVDEVLLVGFSVGSIWSVSVADRCARRLGADHAALHRLSLLTLGHCVPLLGLQAAASEFRAELQHVGVMSALCWVDVSAPADWGSFALLDPVRLCAAGGSAPAHNPRLMASPRFHTLFSPAAYAALKKDKRRMHMQYLMAGERVGTYDYFALTAGPLGLRQRVATGRVA